MFAAILVYRRAWRSMTPLACAAAVLLAAARGDGRELLARVPPSLEQLQRLRAPYAWISMWCVWQVEYDLLLAAIAAAAFRRIRAKVNADLRALFFGLGAIGLLSMPLSWLLLERGKWALVPQFQPMRALLFIELFNADPGGRGRASSPPISRSTMP